MAGPAPDVAHVLSSRAPCRARTEDDADDELLSVVAVKGGKKLVAGSQSGVLLLYSWGYFNDCSDRCHLPACVL